MENKTAIPRYFMVGLERDILGFSLEIVESVMRAVDFAPVPQGGEYLQGVVNVHGTHLPVLNLRRVLRKPDAPVRANQRIVLISAGGQRAAVYVDEVYGIMAGNEAGTDFAKLLEAHQAPGISGVVDYRGQTALIHDLGGLIHGEQERIRELRLEGATGGGTACSE